MPPRYRTSLLRDPKAIETARKAGGWPSGRIMKMLELCEEHDVELCFPAAEPERPPTWEELVDLEPRLLALVRSALETDGSRPDFCANARWYGYGGQRGLKPRLLMLVGHDAAPFAPPLLRTRAAYDVAYHTVYEALPNCKRCGCF
jgi:hypothetical protein